MREDARRHCQTVPDGMKLDIAVRSYPEAQLLAGDKWVWVPEPWVAFAPEGAIAVVSPQGLDSHLVVWLKDGTLQFSPPTGVIPPDLVFRPCDEHRDPGLLARIAQIREDQDAHSVAAA